MALNAKSKHPADADPPTPPGISVHTAAARIHHDRRDFGRTGSALTHQGAPSRENPMALAILFPGFASAHTSSATTRSISGPERASWSNPGNCAVESAWSSCLPLGNTVNSCRFTRRARRLLPCPICERSRRSQLVIARWKGRERRRLAPFVGARPATADLERGPRSVRIHSVSVASVPRGDGILYEKPLAARLSRLLVM
jgi:hypothetical protein